MLHYEAIDPSTLEVLKRLLQIQVFSALRLTLEKEVDKIRLAQLEDIAAMKLSAVTGRGTKKDFVDISFLLQHFSLNQMVEFYSRKYYDGSEFLVLKSLTYFADADQDPDPVMLRKMEWEDIKGRIVKTLEDYL